MTVVLVLVLGLVLSLVGWSCVVLGRRVSRGLRPGAASCRAEASRGLRSRLATAGDAGSVIVEAALITPIFILVVIGVVEFGFAYKDQLAVESAVRAGARLASAEPRISTFATDAASQVAVAGSALSLPKVTSLWIYKANTAGYPSGSNFSSCPVSTCDSFTWNSGSGTFTQSGGSWTSTGQDACQGEQDSIGVYVSYAHQTVTRGVIFGGPTLTLSSHTVMRLEPIPTLQSGGCK